MRPSRIISVVFHPVFMPLIGVCLLLNYGGWLTEIDPSGKRSIYLIVSLTTLMMPLLIMPVLLKTKIIHSYLLVDREERRIPLLLTALMYLTGAYLLQRVDAPILLSLFLNGSSLIILSLVVINWRWKISMHMAGIGGVTGMLLAISIRWMLEVEPIIAILFLVAGFVGFARLKDNDHSPAQVYAGYLLGFGVNFLLILLV